MSAGLYDFIIEQGVTFSEIFEIFDVYYTEQQLEDNPDLENVVSDLTGWSARLQSRKKHQSSTSILNLDMGTGISIPNPTNGKIFIELTSEETAALDFTCSVYDLELYVDGSSPEIVDRIIEGKITLSRESTR